MDENTRDYSLRMPGPLEYLGNTLTVFPLTGSASEQPTVWHDESAPPNRILTEGTVINGRYKVLSVVGRGGMGMVYRVEDFLFPERHVALKSVLADRVGAGWLSHLQCEFKTMAQLRHPNIAEVYDFERFIDGSDHFFTMEYVAGQDALLATDTDTYRILEIIVQVCRALSYLHHRKIIHFDLKPANILVDRNGHVKVVDFGLAGVRADDRVIGTPAYMAPEMTRVGDVIDGRADLYSLGITAYHLLCRKLPYHSDDLAVLLNQHACQPLEFDLEARRRIPDWMRDMIVRLCAKHPLHRYPTANSVIAHINSQHLEPRYPLNTAETRDSYVTSSRHVGRGKELRAVGEFIRARIDGTDGASSAYFIGGASGVGKSRLMRELRQQAQLAGITFVEANCYQAVLGDFAPIVDVLRHVLRIAQSSGAQHVIRHYGAFIRHLDPYIELDHSGNLEPALFSASAEAARATILAHTVEFLISISERVPYVLYLNDLHWARQGTIDVLTRLLRRTEPGSGTLGRIAFIGTYRDTEVEGTALDVFLARTVGRQRVEHCRLQPLVGGEVGELMGTLLGVDVLPDPLVRLVALETGGNPFLVEEVVRVLVERGIAQFGDLSWTTRVDAGDIDVAAAVRSGFLVRAESLPPPIRGTLDVIAAYGQPIGVRLLTEVLMVNSDQLHESIRPLMQKQIIIRLRGQSAEFCFAHDRIREDTYNLLSPERRRECHSMVLAGIERITENDNSSFPYELADHAWRADNVDKVLRYSLSAADHARSVYANDLAVQLLERAVVASNQLKQSNIVKEDILERLADARGAKGDYEGAISGYGELLTIRNQDPIQPRLRRKLANVYLQKGDPRRCAESISTAIGERRWVESRSRGGAALLTTIALARVAWRRMLRGLFRKRISVNEKQRRLELADAYIVLGFSYYFVNPREIFRVVLLGLDAAERAGPSTQLATLYSPGLVVVLCDLTFYGVAVRYAERAADIGRQISSPLHIAQANLYKASACYMMADWAKGIELAKDVKATLTRAGQMIEVTNVYTQYALCLFRLGRLREAEHVLTEAIDVVDRYSTGEALGKRFLPLFRSWADIYLGEWRRAEEQLREVIDSAAMAGDLYGLSLGHMVLGRSRFLNNDLDSAIRHLTEACSIRTRAKLTRTEYGMDAYAYLAEAVYAKMHRERDKESTALALLGYAANAAVRLSRRRPNHRVLGELAFGLWRDAVGDSRSARRAFERSCAHGKALGATLMEGEAREAFAKHLAACQEGVVAKVHLRAAIDLFHGCEAHPCYERASQLLRTWEEQ